MFGLGRVDCVLWLDWEDAGLELVAALLVLRLALLLVGAEVVVVDERTGAGLEDDAVDEWEVDGAGRLLEAVLDAAAELDTAELDALADRECVGPAVPAGVEAGSDWLTGTGPPWCERAGLCGELDEVVAPACRFGMVGTFSVGCDFGANSIQPAPAMIARKAREASSRPFNLRRRCGFPSCRAGPRGGRPPGGAAAGTGPVAAAGEIAPVGSPANAAAPPGAKPGAPSTLVAPVGLATAATAAPATPAAARPAPAAIAPAAGIAEVTAVASPVRRARATAAALGRSAGSEAVIAASSAGHGSGRPAGIAGAVISRATSTSCIVPSKLRAPVSASINTRPRE